MTCTDPPLTTIRQPIEAMGRAAAAEATGMTAVLGGEESAVLAAIEKQDMWLSPAVVLTVGSVMTFVSLLYSPETKDLQLDEVGEKERAFEAARDARTALAT